MLKNIQAIDKRTYQFIDSLRNIEKEGVTKQTFNDTIFETFTTQSISGNVVELKPGTTSTFFTENVGGANIQVTWNSKDEFIHLIEVFKLNEFHLQTEAIARGVSQIVPIQVIYFKAYFLPSIDFIIAYLARTRVPSLWKTRNRLGLSHETY